MTVNRTQRWFEIKVVYLRREKSRGLKIHETRAVCMLQCSVHLRGSGLLCGVLVSIGNGRWVGGIWRQLFDISQRSLTLMHLICWCSMSDSIKGVWESLGHRINKFLCKELWSELYIVCIMHEHFASVKIWWVPIICLMHLCWKLSRCRAEHTSVPLSLGVKYVRSANCRVLLFS